MARSWWRQLSPGLLLIVAVGPAEAGELGHYVPGLPNIRDVVMPPPGVYGVVYTYYFTTDDFRDRNESEVRSIDVRGRTVTLDVDVDVYSIAPTVLWNTGFIASEARNSR